MMTPSLFSQSVFALGLDEAIDATAAAGFPVIELACRAPHFGLDTAGADPERVAARIREAGLAVSALSLFNHLTDPDRLDAEVDAAATFIRAAPLFGTTVLKLTPGSPASAEATELHWETLRAGLERLVPLAREAGVRLAFETHMRQLTDTLASSLRFLELAPAEVVGLTVDFSNLSFAGESMAEAVPALADRTLHTHVKNGTVDAEGGWHFLALDQGLTDYPEVLSLLADAGYDGYLSIECLGDDARTAPLATARRDLAILQAWLHEVQP